MDSRAQGLSSCGTQAWLPCDKWNPPGPGIEPVSPALAGELLTTGPSRKSWSEPLNQATKIKATRERIGKLTA